MEFFQMKGKNREGKAKGNEEYTGKEKRKKYVIQWRK